MPFDQAPKFSPDFNENTERQLSVGELRRLMYLSFKLSQGAGETVHTALVAWSVKYYGVQSQEFCKLAAQELKQALFDKDNRSKLEVAKRHKAGQIIPGEGRKSAATEISFVSGYNRSDLERHSYTIEEFFDFFLTRDLKYLREGRPNRDASAPKNTLAETYFSFVVNYVIRGERTGDDSFDALFLQMRNVCTWSTDINELVFLYNSHHPETPITPSEYALFRKGPSSEIRNSQM